MPPTTSAPATAPITIASILVTASQLAAAEEAFLSSTSSDVCPVVKLDGSAVGDGAIGPVTQRLMGLFAEELQRETGGVER